MKLMRSCSSVTFIYCTCNTVARHPIPPINALYWLPVSYGSRLEVGSNRISQTLTLPTESFDLVVMARYVPVEEQESEHLKWMRLAMEMVCIFLRID